MEEAIASIVLLKTNIGYDHIFDHILNSVIPKWCSCKDNSGESISSTSDDQNCQRITNKVGRERNFN